MDFFGNSVPKQAERAPASDLSLTAHGVRTPIGSIIIPAHNEERTIARLLKGIGNEATEELEILVVCNGCTDDTAGVARRTLPMVTILSLHEPSKRAALAWGDQCASAFPRVFVDADVEIDAGDIVKLVRAVGQEDGAMASAPQRVIPLAGVHPVVRWYYQVWEALPQVRSGLFGRGVIALSRAGNERVRQLPQLMSDDLVMSMAFDDTERQIIADAKVIVRPPKTVADLLRRRIRVATGNTQVDAAGIRSVSTKTSLRTLGAVVREQPRLILRLPVFLGIAVVSRVAARRAVSRGDFTTWNRDESSRW